MLLLQLPCKLKSTLYNKLGLESLIFRQMLCIFYKIKILKLPEYLFCLIPSDQCPYNTQDLDFVEI